MNQDAFEDRLKKLSEAKLPERDALGMAEKIWAETTGGLLKMPAANNRQNTWPAWLPWLATAAAVLFVFMLTKSNPTILKAPVEPKPHLAGMKTIKYGNGEKWRETASFSLELPEDAKTWPKCFALSPSGLLVAADLDNQLTVWDLPSGRLLARGEERMAGLSMLAFSADSSLVLSAGKKIKIWKSGSAALVKEYDLKQRAVWAEFSADGKNITASAAGLWTMDLEKDLPEKMTTGEMSPSTVRGKPALAPQKNYLLLSPDRRFGVAQMGGTNISILPAPARKDPKAVGEIKAGNKAPAIEEENNAGTPNIGVKRTVKPVRITNITADKAHYVMAEAALFSAGRLQVVEIKSDAKVAEIPLPEHRHSRLQRPLFSADGNLMLCALGWHEARQSNANVKGDEYRVHTQIVLYDAKTHESRVLDEYKSADLPVHFFPSCAFLSGGKQMVGSNGNGLLRVWNLETEKLDQEFGLPLDGGLPLYIAAAADKKIFCVLDSAGKVRVYQPEGK